MIEELEKQARRYQEIQDELGSIQSQLQEARSEKFGTDSSETEERARAFFADVTDNGGEIEDIDELKEKLRQTQAERETTRDKLWDLLKNFQLPLDHSIKQTDDGLVMFPYDRELTPEVTQSIEDVLTDVDLTKNGVQMGQNAVIADTDDVEEAMDMVQNRIDKIRASANIRGEIDQEVENLRSRDEKLVKALYVLHKEEHPLSKAELEDRIEVEDGALRGVLYYSFKNDEYLTKNGKEFSLSELGEMVMEQYAQHYNPFSDSTDAGPDTDTTQEELA
ncbi:hypothetical protein [Salinigranum salinum]|uniref:hypothetical protein n=1 Tax=Salinigranum salinum TaxID=1364937 RepID=UPI001260C7AF|nr:hypothetical protein [Salinigranum salinum]